MFRQISVWDDQVTRQVQKFNRPFIRHLLIPVSWFGDFPQVYILAPLPYLWLLLRGYITYFLVSSASLISLLGFIVLIKLTFRRSRPPPASGIRVHKIQPLSSFPSSHTAMYMVYFGLLISFINQSLQAGPFKLLLLLFLSTPMILVGPSRVYRGEHWTSDTVVGYIIGLFWLFGTLNFLSPS